ncbi:hypothetical protein CHS0354_035534 [Potamilus streckersoni]|uniref:Uncharacterized protein n=1 Tax=Potamilus streckersoni TaxID=2493646 RepID=A0AAE0VJ99_9BIVA|nr:hypothetical protein CHS0354_035534 [Potamilus streckersoni]
MAAMCAQTTTDTEDAKDVGELFARIEAMAAFDPPICQKSNLNLRNSEQRCRVPVEGIHIAGCSSKADVLEESRSILEPMPLPPPSPTVKQLRQFALKYRIPTQRARKSRHS